MHYCYCSCIHKSYREFVLLRMPELHFAIARNKSCYHIHFQHPEVTPDIEIEPSVSTEGYNPLDRDA